MIIHLVRHGQSAFNAGLSQGPHVDAEIPLTETGVEQARQAGRNLGHDFVCNSIIYTSPYLRARQTLAALIDGSNAALHGGAGRIFEDPRLRESEFGFNKAQNIIEDEKKVRDEHGYFYYRYLGGSSPADVFDRVATFIDSMIRQSQRKRTTKILIVSHGITIRCFVMRFLHLSVEEFDSIENPSNCDIITIAPKTSRLIPDPNFVSGKWGVQGLRFRNLNHEEK